MSLAVEVTTKGSSERFVVTPAGSDEVIVRGASGETQLPVTEVPALVAAMLDLHPTNFEDRAIDLPGTELDGLVDDGTARMLALGPADDDAPALAVIFDHAEQGYLAADAVDGEAVTLRTLRSLDVWLVISTVVADLLEA